MSRYLRPRLPGVPIFFTVALAQRGSRLLAEQVDGLREAVKATRAERPFGIEAWAVLPDHLHGIRCLPDGDSDYSTRWRLMKARFSRGLPVGQLRDSHVARQERGISRIRHFTATRPPGKWRRVRVHTHHQHMRGRTWCVRARTIRLLCLLSFGERSRARLTKMHR